MKSSECSLCSRPELSKIVKRYCQAVLSNCILISIRDKNFWTAPVSSSGATGQAKAPQYDLPELPLYHFPKLPRVGDAGAFVALFRFHGPFWGLKSKGRCYFCYFTIAIVPKAQGDVLKYLNNLCLNWSVLPKNTSSHKNQQILSFQENKNCWTAKPRRAQRFFYFIWTGFTGFYWIFYFLFS